MAATVQDIPPPLKDIPTAKEKKYDRQLRLWGAPGQVALEETHILLINSGTGVTGVETLKNLVLPGVGQFTILDDAVVTKPDLGVNFFLEESSLGKSRAEETVRLLKELNPGVEGHAINEPLDQFLQRPNAISPYSLVLAAAPINPTLLAKIQNGARTLNIPVFYFHCVGYMSSFSVLLPSAFPIVDTHPDPTATTDLRLLTPWPELTDFAREKTADLEEGKLNAQDKAHIPWVCLLLHYLEQWKQAHDGKLPSSYAEKSEFRTLVRVGDPHEENWDEACAAVLKSLNPPTPSSSVREILEAPEARDITSLTPPFWLIANAVQHFYTEHNQLPLPGAVPDMKAQSADYIRLQNIYKTKARADAAEVLSHVRKLEQTTNRDPDLAIIDEKEVENFCKGAAHVHLVRGRSFHIPETGKSAIKFSDRAKAMAAELTTPDSLIVLYIAFLAWDTFVATNVVEAPAGQTIPHIPGAYNDWEADASVTTVLAHKLIDSLIAEASVKLDDEEETEVMKRTADYVVEITRAGGGELHNIASLTGGLVAQEVIKVVTRQYVPVDNWCGFDGIASRTGVLRL